MSPVKGFRVLCVLLLFPLPAEETGWVLAAEKFESLNMPVVHESLATVIPQLILSRMISVSDRSITGVETKARELSVLSEKRLALVRERADLILARDKILLSPESEYAKKQDMAESKKKIADKEKEIVELDKTIAEKIAAKPGKVSSQSISLWKSGTSLYTRNPDVSLGKSLSNDKLSAVITGSVEDIAGYLLISARLETGLSGLESPTVSEAAPYDELENLVTAICVRLLPDLSGRRSITLHIATEPETARVFIDGRLVTDSTVPVSIFAGEHTMSVSATGFISATRTYNFRDAEEFSVRIALEPKPLVSVSFDTKGMPAPLYLHTQYIGETPLTAEIPAFTTVGEITSDDVQTFFIFAPDHFDGVDGNKQMRLVVRPNTVNTKKRVEKRRRVFYGSLGALYLSLPATLLSYGIYTNKYSAYQSGKLENTQDTVDEINNWMTTALVTRYVSIGLGVNVAIQLFRYILAADQATPKYAVDAGE